MAQGRNRDVSDASKAADDRRNRDVRDADDVVREYYEGEASMEASMNEVREEFGDTQDASSTDLPKAPSREHPPGTSAVAGGDVDARWDRADAGEETVGGSHAMPDQDLVDDVGEAAGLTYQDTEPLRGEEKVVDRDTDRWELNPASSEDYQERQQQPQEAERRSAQSGHKRGQKRQAS